MATYCPEDEDRELFSCPICFEDYDLLDTRRAPKLLLCLHTFCYECTQKLWKNDGSLECSMCRMQHEKVCLEDLFDNPVIIQHLEREQEEKDFEFATKIDQEMRNEFGGSPVIVAENNSILEEHSERDGFSSSIEFLDLAEENIETGDVDLMVPEENSPRVSNPDDVQEEDEEEELEVELEANERNDSQSQLFQGLLDSLRVSQEVRSVSDEEIEVSGVIVNQVAQEEVHQDDSSDDSNEDDSGNPSFCIENVQKLLVDEDDDVDGEDEVGGVEEEEEEEVEEEEEEVEDDDDEDDDDVEEEEQSEDEMGTNIEMNDNPTFTMENIQCLFGYTEDDDDDDDERFHSACDDIGTAFWGGDDDLDMQDGSEEDADTNAYCWQIVNREPLLED
ncbi:acidic leucine-rich nuclear phosphoprotein 32 family member E-like [Palaemon carinicauda]|uniref:acidic leucine-rich nuclear phosphoprotein 32 family member E-like n=1 Tax=Palaemon carinicauda TaxID=392227 RepID=UPI0035B675CE